MPRVTYTYRQVGGVVLVTHRGCTNGRLIHSLDFDAYWAGKKAALDGLSWDARHPLFSTGLASRSWLRGWKRYLPRKDRSSLMPGRADVF